MAKPYLEVRGGPSEGDLMTWPNPADPLEVEWRLVHLRTTFKQEPSTSDLMVAASFMSAYRALIAMPQKTRNARIQQIKAAMLASDPEPHDSGLDRDRLG